MALSILIKRKSRNIPPEILAPIFVDTLERLHAAHEVKDERAIPLDIVHRDVSPQNILVGIDGSARIADFGVAKARIRLTHTIGGARKGMLAYLAPEQLIDDDTVDRRVDIFAAGAAMWSALTGEDLFATKADSEAKVMRNILEMEIRPPSNVGRKPPPMFDAVVLRALARDPAERYQTAREMSEALREAGLASGKFASRPAARDSV